MSPISQPPRPLPTSDPHTFLRFVRKLLSSSRTDAVCTDEPCNPLDFPATSPLPRPLIKPDDNSRSTLAPPTTQSPTINTSPTFKSSLHRLSTWWPFQTDYSSPATVDVALAPGKLRYAAAGAPGDDDDLIRDEDYVSPPSPNSGSRRGIVNAGQHGNADFVFASNRFRTRFLVSRNCDRCSLHALSFLHLYRIHDHYTTKALEIY
ncbi:hypothetical protein F4604DRAFT_62940 [Suillus subluteus]|nr:hypothetical protein F4604DRAFT_62940 [Suillus subluteus]